MSLFKRVEVWFLLALTIGGLAFVLLSERDKEQTVSGLPVLASPDTDTLEKPRAFSVNEMRLKRDYDNALLEIHVSYDNKAHEDLELVAPNAKLLSSPDPAGKENITEVAPFFLPFAPPQKIAAGQISSAALKYWLEPAHLDGPLWLQIRDERQLVKSAGSFNLSAIKNQDTLTFKDPAWPAPPPRSTPAPDESEEEKQKQKQQQKQP